MKKRYLYSILYGIPGFFISLIVSFVIFGAVTGILWIFVFGDDPWPSATDIILPIFFMFSFLLAWSIAIAMGYRTGKNLENDALLNKKHVLASGGLTLLFILFIVIQQWRVGTIGPKSDGELCSDYCSLQGYLASGMPAKNSRERTCSCFGDSGNEMLQVPLERIIEDESK